MRKLLFQIVFLSFCFSYNVINASEVLTLDSCRSLAISNNKQLKISSSNIQKATFEKRKAFAQYFPDISFKGSYLWNQKNLSLLDADKFLPIGSILPDGSFGFTQDQVKGVVLPNGKWVPIDANGVPFDPHKNPEKIQWKSYTTIPKSEFEVDISNVFLGSLNLVQPIFMGGKIVAYNKITSYAEELASSLNDTKLQDIILRVDEIYWQNISLINKKKLVDNYVQLLRKMNEDVTDFHTEGLATKADELSARVKLNEAEMLQTKTDNGLELSKMLLCEICGLDIDSDIILADAQVEELSISIDSVGKVNLEFINNVFANRSEIRSLELANKIFDTKIDIARSGLMPTVALTANYMLSNPSMFSGVKKEFAGMFSVGVLVNVPIFHFGSTYNDIAISKIESHSKHLELEEAQEKIKLQVHQSVFRIAEANKQLIASQRNKENASENLRYAQIGFAEGVVPIINLMEAQTAWFKAHSQFIDSQIDVQLSKAYLNKAIGKKLK